MDTSPAKVQHVTKASSDQLLRKFAEVGSESDAKRRRKRVRPVTAREADDNCVVERKSLLPLASRRSSQALIRRLGIGRSRLRGRDFNKRSILGTIEKTWRRTVEGASKVFLEKHHNRHKRLINDIA